MSRVKRRMEDGEGVVEFQYNIIIKTTELAILFHLPNIADNTWLAKKDIIHLDEETKTIQIPEWLAKDKEII